MNSLVTRATAQRPTFKRSPKSALARCIEKPLRGLRNIAQRLSPKSHRQRVGRIGEHFAKNYLEQMGMRFIRANWTCALGEIDLVFQDDEDLVFVEVKSRVWDSTSPFRGDLFQNITAAKQYRLRRLVEVYLANYYSRRTLPPVRIDVLGVALASDRRTVLHVEHIAGAI